MGPRFREDDSGDWRELRSVVGLLAVQHALECIEVPLCRRRALVEVSPADIALGLLYYCVGKLLQRLPRPHRVDLNLRRALDVIQPVIGGGDGLADRADAMI